MQAWAPHLPLHSALQSGHPKANEGGPLPVPPLRQGDTVRWDFKLYSSRVDNQQQSNKTIIHGKAERQRASLGRRVSGGQEVAVWQGSFGQSQSQQDRLAGQMTHWVWLCSVRHAQPGVQGSQAVRGEGARFKTSLCHLLGCVPWARRLTSLSLGFLPF